MPAYDLLQVCVQGPGGPDDYSDQKQGPAAEAAHRATAHARYFTGDIHTLNLERIRIVDKTRGTGFIDFYSTTKNMPFKEIIYR